MNMVVLRGCKQLAHSRVYQVMMLVIKFNLSINIVENSVLTTEKKHWPSICSLVSLDFKCIFCKFWIKHGTKEETLRLDSDARMKPGIDLYLFLFLKEETSVSDAFHNQSAFNPTECSVGQQLDWSQGVWFVLKFSGGFLTSDFTQQGSHFSLSQCFGVMDSRHTSGETVSEFMRRTAFLLLF